MTPSIRIRFFIVAALVTSAQSAFAGGNMLGGGNFSRPAFKPPVVVNRSLTTHNVQAVSPSYVVKNGNYNGVVRSNVLPSTGTNTNVKPLCHHEPGNSNVVPADPNRIPADPNRVPRNSNRVPRDLTTDLPKASPVPSAPDSSHIIPKPSRPEIPEIIQSVSSSSHTGIVSSSLIQVDPSLFRNIRPNFGIIGGHLGSGSPTNTITVPPGANKHINPLPGEHPIGVRPPVPGIRNPGNGTSGSGGTNIGIFLGQISSLLPGPGAAGAVAGSVEEIVPVEDSPAPAASPVSSAPAPATSAEAQSKDVLDVELTDVRLVDAGSLERNVGPRYRLYYRNAGTIEAPKFHVSVAVDLGDKVTEKAELVTVEAVGVKPGKSQTVDVRLPVEVLKMAIDYEGRPAAFNAFVALIDSDNDLAESNETNNLLVLSRTKILPVE